MPGFASLPFEIYEKIFSYLRETSLAELSFQDGQVPSLPYGYLSPLPLICRSSYPAGQAALLHTLRIPRSASSFLAYFRSHPGESRNIHNLSIENTPLTAADEKALDWLDTTEAVLYLLEQCTKLEAVHLTLRAGAECHEHNRLRSIIAMDNCKILSIAKGTGKSGKSLLETLASGGWRLRADTLRLECINSQDLILSDGHHVQRSRFISARHLIISVMQENLKIYYPTQFQGILNSLVTYPEALSIYKTRMDSMAFSTLIHTLGPSLRYLAFTWSAYLHQDLQKGNEIIPYLYGGTFNPLAVGTILLSCRNLQEVKVDMVDLLPFRAMRFPPSVKRLRLQWHTSRYFFTDMFPWLQNHLCLGNSELEYLEINVIKDWEMRMGDTTAVGQGEIEGELQREDTRIVRLVDDYVIAKAATELCAVHGIRTDPPCLKQAWKDIRSTELSETVWADVSRRLAGI